MCGRYAASKSTDELVEEFEVTEPPEVQLAPDYNMAPSKPIYAVLERLHDDTTVRRLAVVRWGLVPSWAKDPSVGNRMANARVETAAEKPSFRKAFSARRCIIPADGYYEWQTTPDPQAPLGKSGKPIKQPWYIHPADGSVLSMAGLYEIWRDRTRDEDDPAAWLWTAAVLTTEATDELGQIHDRTPVMVAPTDRDEWLDPNNHDVSRLLARLAPASTLALRPVSTAVNSVRNNGPELLNEVIPGESPKDSGQIKGPAGNEQPSLFG